MANGSSIINTSPSGLPLETEDRAYAFCIGTQIFQTPEQDPREGRFSFKIEPSLFDATVSGDAVGASALGLATAANISSIGSWSSAAQIRDNGSTYGVFAVSFAENSSNNGRVNVCCAGSTVGYVQKNKQSTSTDIGFDTLTISGHGYSIGDAVVIYSGSPPAPLQSGTTYYIIPSGADKIKLAVSRAAAVAGSGINLTVSGGPVFLKSNDVFELRRNGTSGQVSLLRNDSAVYVFSSTLETLRPFFWTREASNSATIPLFKEIKVSGAS